MSAWDDFDALCASAEEQKQAELESGAMAGLASAANLNELRSAMSYALGFGLITLEDNWLGVVGMLQKYPFALVQDMDQKFFASCPKPLIEEFVASEKGVLATFLGSLNDPKRQENPGLNTADIRLMHLIIESLLALGQTERLKRVAKMFIGVSESRSEDGRLPGSVYHKLLEKKIIERPSQQASNGQHSSARPSARPTRRLDDDNVAVTPRGHKLTGRTYTDTNPAHPPKNGGKVVDRGLAAQLAAAVN